MTARLPDTAVATRTAASAGPALVAGAIMHRRTRPTLNAFRYPAFCLRLPLSRLHELAGTGVRCNRRGLVSFHERDHGPRDGTPLAVVDARSSSRAKASSPTARSCCTRSRACWATCSTR